VRETRAEILERGATVRVAGAALVFVFVPALAIAQTCVSASGATVEASGTITLRLRPDRVSFSVGVENVRPSVTEALAANNAKLAAVVGALKAQSVASADIQTAAFEIDSTDESGNKLDGFRVSNKVSVTRSDTTSVGSLLQAAVNAGANQAGGLRFFVGEPGKHLDRGLELAFQAATAKASKLAVLAGRSLGSVICVAEGGYSTTRNFSYSNEAVMVQGESPSIEEGVEELSFSVHVVYALK
jgi:uncharacterized protein YggE